MMEYINYLNNLTKLLLKQIYLQCHKVQSLYIKIYFISIYYQGTIGNLNFLRSIILLILETEKHEIPIDEFHKNI